MTVSIRTDLEDDLRRLRSELDTLRYELAQARRGCDAAGGLAASVRATLKEVPTITQVVPGLAVALARYDETVKGGGAGV